MSNSVTVRTNSLFGKGTRDLPKFQAGPRYIEVYHREYIKDIVGAAEGTGAEGAAPSEFDIESFDINPGLAPTEGSATVNGLFPWLSTIASQFETYQFMGLALEFVSTCGEMNSTSGGLGTVVQVVEYNALNPVFQNKESMMNYDAAVSAKPTVSALCGVECSPNDLPSTHLYVRSAPVPANADARLYDIGNYQIATQSLPQLTMPVGELWVTYHVRLYQPKLSVSGVVPPPPVPVPDSGLWAYTEIDSVYNSVNNYAPTHPTPLAYSMLQGTNGWNAGFIFNDADNGDRFRTVFNAAGWVIPAGTNPADNTPFRVIGPAVVADRVIEIQFTFNVGDGLLWRNIPPALSKQFTCADTDLLESNIMFTAYPGNIVPAVGQVYSYGFVCRWLVRIAANKIVVDGTTGEPWLPITLVDSTRGTQTYSMSGNWAGSLSIAVALMAEDETYAGPLSYPYVGPPNVSNAL